MPKQLYNLPAQSTADERFVQAMNWINVGASLVNCTSTTATRPLEMYAPLLSRKNMKMRQVNHELLYEQNTINYLLDTAQ